MSSISVFRLYASSQALIFLCYSSVFKGKECVSTAMLHKALALFELDRGIQRSEWPTSPRSEQVPLHSLCPPACPVESPDLSVETQHGDSQSLSDREAV